MNFLLWYVVHTKPKQEERVCNNLSTFNIEALGPKIRESRRNPYTNEVFYTTKYLFPRYVFVRFNAEASLHNIRFTRGIHSIVSFGNGPTPVDDGVIEMIRSRMNRDGYVTVGEKFQVGDKVYINREIFKQVVGVFEREMPDKDRVMILLESLRFQAHIIVERDAVKKITKDGALA